MADTTDNDVPTQAERLAALVPNSGRPDGTIEVDVHGQSVKFVNEYDGSGNITGWHVEPVENGVTNG